MKKPKEIVVTINLLIMLMLCSVACGQEATPLPTDQPPTSPLPTPTEAEIILPTPTITVLTSSISNLPTPTSPITTIAIVNITNVPILPTLNTTPLLLPTFTPNALTPTNPPPGEPDAEERAFLELLNNFRKSRNAPPLIFDPNLFRSARWMAQDMATKSYISHTDSGGRDVATRIHSFGYNGQWVGENIAGGMEHASENLTIWQSDAIHLNNMANPFWTKAGIGRYYFLTGFNRWVWVLDMGKE